MDKKPTRKKLRQRIKELEKEAEKREKMLQSQQALQTAAENSITEAKRSEQALRESERIFDLFMEHSPIYVFFKDEDIRSIRLSRNYEQMLGRPISELLGKTMDDLFPSDLAKTDRCPEMESSFSTPERDHECKHTSTGYCETNSCLQSSYRERFSANRHWSNCNRNTEDASLNHTHIG
jgi:PAS domain-containing protein